MYLDIDGLVLILIQSNFSIYFNDKVFVSILNVCNQLATY